MRQVGWKTTQDDSRSADEINLVSCCLIRKPWQPVYGNIIGAVPVRALIEGLLKGKGSLNLVGGDWNVNYDWGRYLSFSFLACIKYA